MLVFFWFTRVSSVKALISKCSHGQQSIHTGGKRLWRVESVSLHTGKPPENQQRNGKNATVEVNTLKSKPSHSNLLKIRHKKPSCEGVNAFFGKQKAYRSVWTFGEIDVFQLLLFGKSSRPSGFSPIGAQPDGLGGLTCWGFNVYRNS